MLHNLVASWTPWVALTLLIASKSTTLSVKSAITSGLMPGVGTPDGIERAGVVVATTGVGTVALGGVGPPGTLEAIPKPPSMDATIVGGAAVAAGGTAGAGILAGPPVVVAMDANLVPWVVTSVFNLVTSVFKASIIAR